MTGRRGHGGRSGARRPCLRAPTSRRPACSARRRRRPGSRSTRPCRSRRPADLRPASSALRRGPRRAASRPRSRLRRPSRPRRRASATPACRARGRGRPAVEASPSSSEPLWSRRPRDRKTRAQSSACERGERTMMYIAGEWTTGSREEDVRSPFDGEVVGVVPVADARGRRACPRARRSRARARCDGCRRGSAPRSCAAQPTCWSENARSSLARSRPRWASRSLEASGEAARIPPLLRTSASRARGCTARRCRSTRRRTARASSRSRIRQPCGVVVAISPFNYPALLVAHKVGPALAAGNAVVLKPARQTPLTALLLTRTLLEAGLPENAIQCLTGPGAELGRVLCADPRVRKISFTGSTAVGEEITRVAGDQAPLARARRELPADRPPRRRPRARRRRDGDGRLRQRRPGVHLRAAGARRPRGLRRVRRAA